MSAKVRAALKGGGAIVLLASFFVLTGPVNRSEAEDAYEYAWRVESFRGSELLDGQHLLYFPAASAVYRFFHWVTPGIRAIHVLSWISALATGGMLVLFYRLLRGRLDFNKADALTGCVVFGLLYGIWRYAAEAEIYGLSGLFALLLLAVAVGDDGRVRYPALAAVCGVAGVGIHVMNILPAFAVGIAWLLQRQWKNALVYGGAFGLLMVLMYGGAFFAGLDAEQLSRVSPLAYQGGLLSPASYARAIVGLGSGVFAYQFIFGFSVVRSFALRSFPGMMLNEECFFGEKIGAGPAATGLVFLVMAAGILTVLLFRGFKGWKLDRQRPGAWWLLVISMTWFLLFAVVIFRYDPAAPEFWIQALPALALLAFSFVATGNRMPSIRRGLVVFAGVLLLHNAGVGMFLLKMQDADYNAVKAAPLLERVVEDDLVLSSDNPVFFHYLRYMSPAEVVNLYAVKEEGYIDLRDRVRNTSGTVYAFDDLGNPAPNMRLRTPELWERAKVLGEQLASEEITILP